ncbi:4Fe-4S dicluster domain-containing protein [Blattabacterium cuenoti]|uniref:4Fe-4S dicluster domain-containing protein n=1 Tax=Blattabacterium cuenoti TaxID=1653831 RepID=UPI00163BAEAC|nr:4Fe-4S dicluster domain-containing protein [Blattabacterium cuenoti]
MSIKITEECINCGACELECPNHAIYEGGKKWRMSDGNKKNNEIFNNLQEPIKKNTYFIVPEKCTECIGFYEEPQCIMVCPVNCCVINISETKEELIKKKNFLYN